MSRHWRPEHAREWTVIDGYALGGGGRRRGGGGVVPVVVSAVLIGLLVGGALSWTTQHADSGPSGPIEWNAVQPVPTRAPDAEDVAWEKRANSPVIASGSDAIQTGLPRASGARNDAG